MRIIDADDFYKPFEEARKTLEAIGSVLPEELLDAVLKIYDEIKERLDATPTIDAVEVVRCKDCKFWQDQEEGVIEVPICARPENKYEKLPFRFMIGKDGFCSFAERRSNEID